MAVVAEYNVKVISNGNYLDFIVSELKKNGNDKQLTALYSNGPVNNLEQLEHNNIQYLLTQGHTVEYICESLCLYKDDESDDLDLDKVAELGVRFYLSQNSRAKHKNIAKYLGVPLDDVKEIIKDIKQE